MTRAVSCSPFSGGWRLSGCWRGVTAGLIRLTSLNKRSTSVHMLRRNIDGSATDQMMIENKDLEYVPSMFRRSKSVDAEHGRGGEERSELLSPSSVGAPFSRESKNDGTRKCLFLKGKRLLCWLSSVGAFLGVELCKSLFLLEVVWSTRGDPSVTDGTSTDLGGKGHREQKDFSYIGFGGILPSHSLNLSFGERYDGSS